MLKNLWSEFKAFAFKGNMIELAVAVVVGAAFGNVINAMVKDIINPAISYAVTGAEEARDLGKSGLSAASSGLSTVASKAGIATTGPTSLPTDQTTVATTPPAGTTPPVAKDAPADKAPPAAPKDPNAVVNFDWKIGRFLIGDFVGAIINFIIIAFAVFIMIVKLSDSVMKKVGSTPAPSEPTTKECPECLSIIPLKAKRCSHCTSVLAPA